MAAKAGGLLARPRVRLALDRMTGFVLVALGLGSRPSRRSSRSHPKGSQKTPEPPKSAPLFDHPTQA